MSYRVQRYDAFSGMGPAEKTALVNFLHKNSEEKDINIIKDAIDYALKNKPSFGGIIFMCWEDRRPIGAVLLNNTGMGEYSPKHLLVYAYQDPEFHKEPQILVGLISKAIQDCKGEIAMHLKPGNPTLSVFQSLGFQEQYVELRFNDQIPVASMG